MHYLEPFFSDHNDPTDGDKESGSLRVETLIARSLTDEEQFPRYRQIASEIIQYCYMDPDGLTDFFEATCRDFSNPQLNDQRETFELVMAVLAGTYSLDSCGEFQTYIEDRYREKRKETPELCLHAIRAMDMLDASDINAVLQLSSVEALFCKAMQVRTSVSSERETEVLDKNFFPLWESLMDAEIIRFSDLFRLAGKYLKCTYDTSEDLDKDPRPMLIAQMLAQCAVSSRYSINAACEFLETQIEIGKDFFAEIAGYTFFLIRHSKPSLECDIFSRLKEGFEGQDEPEKEFWAIALAEYSCYDLRRARECIALLRPLTDDLDPTVVCYASNAIAKIVNHQGGSIWGDALISDVGEHLLEKQELPLHTITSQRIHFIFKTIASIDQDNYKEVLSEVENLLEKLRSSDVYEKVRDGIFEVLQDEIQYLASKIHTEILDRVEFIIDNDFLSPEKSELYGYILKVSIVDCLDSQSNKNAHDLSERYSVLSEKMHRYMGAEVLSRDIEEISNYLFSASVVGLTPPLLD